MIKTTTLCAWQSAKCLSEAEHTVGDNKYCLMHSYEQRNLVWRWVNASMLAEIAQERRDKRLARLERERQAMRDALVQVTQSAFEVKQVRDFDALTVEMDCGI